MPRSGSIWVLLSPPGMNPWRRASVQIAASSAPAAPSACPVAPLVELQGTRVPKTEFTALLSELSLLCVPVPWRLM